jgi:hypothetical protein
VVKKIICTDSLSNLIAQQNLVTRKNPKAAELNDLMAEEGNTKVSVGSGAYWDQKK